METWIHRNGQLVGRFPLSTIRERVADGSFAGTDLAWNETKSCWQPLPEFLQSTEATRLPPSSPSVFATEPPPLPAAGSASQSGQLNGPALWNPTVAVLWSVLLSPAFGAFIIWKNWRTLKRSRRALMAGTWFWVAVTLVAVRVLTATHIPLVVSLAFFAGWVGFSAYPQIRYLKSTFKKAYSKRHWFLPIAAGVGLYLVSFVADHVAAAMQKTPLKQSQSEPQKPAEVSRDRVFTPDELRDLYKASVLEVRSTWKQRSRPLWLNKTDAGSSGTGVLLYNDQKYGLVATNWHVVEPSESMTGDYSCGVRFTPDKEFSDCEVVARAKNGVDLALLLVRLAGNWNAKPFPVRLLDQIHEGEACVAIGNALGEGLSITAGLISRFDQSGSITMIRTSTPVSPGNSGGPLILCKGGSLAGIVTLQSRSTSIQNVNFATPAQYLIKQEGWEFQGNQPQAQELLTKSVAASSAGFSPR